MRSIKERLLVEIREDEVRETLNDYEKRKKKERKRQWTQNNYMDNLSGKQRVKQVEIGEHG